VKEFEKVRNGWEDTHELIYNGSLKKNSLDKKFLVYLTE
jgi:hypothetical protein